MIFDISKAEFYSTYHKKDYTRKEVAKKYKISFYKVCEYIKYYNLKKKFIRFTRKELYKLLYKDKILPIVIGKKYNLSITCVRQYMKKYGFKQRAHWEQLNLPKNLTKRQIEYLVGNLLGDGYIHKTKGQGRARFEMEQTGCKKDYIDWLNNIYFPFSMPSYKRYKKLLYKNRQRVYISYVFYTHQHPCFDYWFNLFYPNGKKIIPNNLNTLITAKSLALWWADDGSYRSKTRECVFNAQGFSLKEVKKLKNILFTKFRIEVNLHKQKGRKGYKLYILAKSRKNFFSLITRIIKQIPSMQYKLPNNKTLRLKK